MSAGARMARAMRSFAFMSVSSREGMRGSVSDPRASAQARKFAGASAAADAPATPGRGGRYGSSPMARQSAPLRFLPQNHEVFLAQQFCRRQSDKAWFDVVKAVCQQEVARVVAGVNVHRRSAVGTVVVRGHEQPARSKQLPPPLKHWLKVHQMLDNVETIRDIVRAFELA